MPRRAGYTEDRQNKTPLAVLSVLKPGNLQHIGATMKLYPETTRYRIIVFLTGLLLMSTLIYAQVGFVYEPTRRVDLPQPSGPYAIGTKVFHWVDTSREETLTSDPNDVREIMVQLWYPATDTLGAQPAPYLPELDGLRPYLSSNTVELVGSVRTNSHWDVAVSGSAVSYPVLVFSHGLGNRRSYYTITAEELASHGYVVVGIDHPLGAGSVAFPDGRVIVFDSLWGVIQPPDYSIEERFRFTDERMEIWAADASFAVDQLHVLNRSEDFRGKLDLDRVGIFGHSNGAKAAVVACMLDDRFKACVNLDGWPIHSHVEANGLDQPYMVIEDLRDVTDEELSSWGSTIERYTRNMRDFQDRKERIFAMMTSSSYQIVIRGIRHSYFSDLPTIDPTSVDPDATLLPEEALRIIHDYMLAFFDEHLGDQPSDLLHPQVMLRTYGSEQYRNQRQQ